MHGALSTQQVSKKEFELIFSRFYSRFSDDVFHQGNLTQLLKTLSTAKMLKEKNQGKRAKYLLWHALYGNIVQTLGGAPGEFSAVVNKLVTMVYENIEHVDDKMVSTIFDQYTTTVATDFDDPYDIDDGDWDTFKDYLDALSYYNLPQAQQDLINKANTPW